MLQLTNQGDYHRAWHLVNVANSATEADQIYLQDGNVYVAGLFLGQTQLPQGTLTGDSARVNALLFKLVPEASTPTNTPPVALDDTYKLWKNYVLTVPTCEGVLRNDSNPNLDSLTATLLNDGQHGTVHPQPDGSFTYTPYRDYTGSDHFTYTVDNGKGGSDSATVNILVQGLEAVTFTSTDVPRNILDASTIVTRSSIVVNAAFLVGDLNVALNITHPRTLDLNAFLVGPDGTRVELFTDVGGTKSANFTDTIFDDEATKLITKGTAPFTGSYKPEGVLSAFDRKPVAGTWTLELTDDLRKQTGTLTSWSLIVTPRDPLAASHAQEAEHDVATATLTLAQTQPLLAEARARWQAAGVDTALLSGIDLRIGDLGGTTLGLAAGHTIWLDDNAAGWGWFVDATPRSDTEFLRPGNQGEQHRIDLLTVVMHEMGHLLGYDHDAGGLMAETLTTGARRIAVQDDHALAVDQLFNQSVDLRPDAGWGTWLTEQLELQRPWAKRRR